MKTKFIYLLAFFFLQSHAFGGIYFKQATLYDQSKILKLYHSFTTDDQKHLVTFPKEVDEFFLAKDLEKRKIFLAYDDETQEIISLLKIFLFQDSDINEILENELRCTGQNKKLISSKSFCILKKIEIIQENVVSHDLFISQNQFKLELNNQIFIYYGGAYTQPHFRGKGIHTQLIVESLKILRPEIINQLSSLEDKKEIVFSYGQVLANAKIKGMIHAFLEFLNDLVSGNALILSSNFQHHTYEAYKPSFKFDEIAQKLEVSFPEENRGIGNIVTFTVRKE